MMIIIRQTIKEDANVLFSSVRSVGSGCANIAPNAFTSSPTSTEERIIKSNIGRGQLRKPACRIHYETINAVQCTSTEEEEEEMH